MRTTGSRYDGVNINIPTAVTACPQDTYAYIHMNNDKAYLTTSGTLLHGSYVFNGVYIILQNQTDAQQLVKNINYTETGADTHTNARTKHTENAQTPDPDRCAEHVRCEQVIGPDRHP